jgi:hypothetical protein
VLHQSACQRLLLQKEEKEEKTFALGRRWMLWVALLPHPVHYQKRQASDIDQWRRQQFLSLSFSPSSPRYSERNSPQT